MQRVLYVLPVLKNVQKRAQEFFRITEIITQRADPPPPAPDLPAQGAEGSVVK